jgi:hypothetical protein
MSHLKMETSRSQKKKKTDITGLGGVLMDSATPRSVGYNGYEA